MGFLFQQVENRNDITENLNMSVLVNFAMFPTDKGTSVSKYVSQIIKMIKESGVDYQLSSMATVIETETFSEALQIIEKAYAILEPHSNRVYCSATFDIKKSKSGRIIEKVKSIENKIGEVNK
jgi:uncharacterized protein (TIGR00106 family)